MIRNFKITSNIDDLQVYINRYGSIDNRNIQYRKVYDSSADDWESYDLDNRPYIQLMSGESVEFKNDTGTFSQDNNNYLSFNIYGSDGDRSTADFTVSGNLGSLLYGEYDDSTEGPYDAPQYCFYRLFANSGVTNARNLLLCFGSVGYGAFQQMFEDCRSLTQAPELPATDLANQCYYEMFKGCTSLTAAPELPATTLAQRCYQSMFQGCTSLTTAPELPAAKMETSCYNSMFKQCRSLKKAPVLASTQLANDCYSIMFEDCDLDEAPELPATVLAGACYYHMFTRNRNLKKAPLIAGVQIGSLSYYNMFQDCSSLNEMIYTSTSIPSQTGQWLKGVSSKGTFYYTDKNLNVAAIPRSAAGIPAGWTIQYLAPKPPLVFSINGKAVKALTIK